MLEVQNIWKNYEGKPLLCGVSLAVQPGETVCLLGASGSGKSTLLRIIAGLEKAEKGQVLWQSQDLAEVPVHRRNFGLMFQEYALFPHQSVAENVAFGLRMQKLPRSEISARVKEALGLVNLSNFAARRVTDLSGGEQQRVALARALAPRPRLLMLDEPLGALDRTLKEEVEGEIRRLLHVSHIPAIYVTHDQEEAFATADRLILLNRGEIEQSGTPAEVYLHPATVWVARFLGLSNLLPGKVTGAKPLTVETQLGVFEAAASLQSWPQVGDQVTVLLRPTGAALDPEDRATNRLRGIVKDCVFREGGFRVNLSCPNRQEFSFYLDRAADPGTELQLGLSLDNIQLLRDMHG